MRCAVFLTVSLLACRVGFGDVIAFDPADGRLDVARERVDRAMARLGALHYWQQQLGLYRARERAGRALTRLVALRQQQTTATFTTSGSVDLVMDHASMNVENVTFAEGRLIGVHGSNPFGAAGLQIAGGELVLSSAGGSVIIDNALTVTESGTLRAGAAGGGVASPLTVTLGSETSGVTLQSGTLTLSATDQYHLDVAGPLTGARNATFTLSGADLLSGGTVTLAGGMFSAEAIGKLNSTGLHTRRILQVSGEDAIYGEFTVVPDVGTAPPGSTTGTYLGSGVWFGDDRSGLGVTYVGRTSPEDQEDPPLWVDITVFQALAGDTDVNGDVSFADFNELANNYTGTLDPGTGGKDWSQGDFDLDGDVDSADFSNLVDNYTGTGDWYALKGGQRATPEPSTMAMLAAGILALFLSQWIRVART